MFAVSERKTKLTLIAKSYAKEGFEYLFFGLADECNSCRFRFTCGNLEKGRKYRVISIKNSNNKPKPCKVHESGVVLVEVEESPLVAAVESKKALVGSLIEYHPIKCEENCEAKVYCSPKVREGEKYRIEGIIGELPVMCRKRKDLRIVMLTR